jgi:preprotein translocase subunit YajC
MRAVRSLQSELHEGDDVLTTSGIYGRIVRLGDDDLELEIAPATVIRVARGAIGQRLTDDGDSLADPTNGAG